MSCSIDYTNKIHKWKINKKSLEKIYPSLFDIANMVIQTILVLLSSFQMDEVVIEENNLVNIV